MVDPTENELHFDLDMLLPESIDGFDSGAQTVESKSAEIPSTIGRYQIQSLLGEGGFGRVFRGYDEQLERIVAIKVPHLHRIGSTATLEKYLDEARTLAKLEHPAIVRVHDVGTTENGLPYMVSNYVDGRSLAATLKKRELTLRSGVLILTRIAEALAYIHASGIVHRDVKPANILLSQDDQPFLADFGLAIRDEVIEKDGRRAGTPAYMSPEQARGETHLIDGRTDIFSLGIVLYQMMTGKLPFYTKGQSDGIRKLLERDATPPRQLNTSVPHELERICMKALAKRPSERYSSATDFANDLSIFAENAQEEDQKFISSGATGTTQSASSNTRIDIVPRGLRSFEKHDAGFFSQLLPGPYSREWVPENLLFWQRRLLNIENNFENIRIGVLYGPSGCGKSSFVKAGLVPLIQEEVHTVFVEATTGDTEARILRGVRKRFPHLSVESDLVDSLAEIRRGSKDKRLLIVIDQFEQWLNGRPDQENSALALALRQCDGISLQCLILIRDDFWLAMSRFASIIEIPLRQNQNIMLVDLFSKAHARQVLTLFGVAYGCLPDKEGLSEEQNKFLDRAVNELSEEGRIIPIRLSLFCEMVKSQPWEISTLEKLGGVQGIGARFLEESLSSSVAPASHRVHESAARNVLRLLLPDKGGNLKGNMQPEDRLRAAAGYEQQPVAFAELIDVLDGTLRLIAPTDPAGSLSSMESQSASGDGSRYYQLTHDFLVPELYTWLNKKKRETRRGRAELRLAEYAGLWSGKPVAKFTPGWLEWLNIRWHSSPNSWNRTEKKLMKVARARHLRNSLLALLACVFLVAGGLWWINNNRIRGIVSQLRVAQTDQIETLVDKLAPSPSGVPNALKNMLQSPQSEEAELRLRLGLLQHDTQQADWLEQRALVESMPLVQIIARQLAKVEHKLSSDTKSLIANATSNPQQSLRAAFLVSQFSEIQSSDKDNPGQAAELIRQNSTWIVGAILDHLESAPQDFIAVQAGFAPVNKLLRNDLSEIALTPNKSLRRNYATALLVSYCKQEPNQILDYMLVASPEQYDFFMPELERHLENLKFSMLETANRILDTNV